jgi:hypothetical protein
MNERSERHTGKLLMCETEGDGALFPASEKRVLAAIKSLIYCMLIEKKHTIGANLPA